MLLRLAAPTTSPDTGVVSVFDKDGARVDWVAPCAASIEEAPFPAELIATMQAAGFKEPSPIQRYTWPLALDGWDLIGLAETGSGKTLAFLLPAFRQILHRASKQSRQGHRGTYIELLVLAPTRELAAQVEDSARRFSEGSGLRHTSIYGGVPRGQQLSDLRNHRPHIVIACPGRLNDFLSWNQISLSHVSHLVVDEADRLLDMGFGPQVHQILLHLSPQRQSMLFSATWPEGVRQLAADILRSNYLMICVGQQETELQANDAVSQQVFVLPSVAAKEQALLDQLRDLDAELVHEKVLIFCNSRNGCDYVHDLLQDAGVQCSLLHGTCDQLDREATLQNYRDGAIRILVATDVAARGLDVKGISVVINFDPPHSYKFEDYVHRIGRTGRAGRRGRAVTLLLPKEANQAKAILEVMRRSQQPVSSDLERLAAQAQGTAKERKAQKQADYLQKRQEKRAVAPEAPEDSRLPQGDSPVDPAG
jgi:ATP-dependent RNA helicase DDX5/DBP2